MARVSFELFKSHTRTTSFSRDDDYLQAILKTAESFVLNLTGYSPEEWAVVPDEAFPDELRQLILIVGADMYAEREMTVPATYQLRPWVKGLLMPFQKMKGGSITERLIEKYSSKEDEP